MTIPLPIRWLVALAIGAATCTVAGHLHAGWINWTMYAGWTGGISCSWWLRATERDD